MDSGTPFVVGQLFTQASRNFTLTISEGTEDFISIITLVFATTEMQTSPPITTEIRMTNPTPPTMESYNSRKNDNHCNDGIFDKDFHARIIDNNNRSGES